MNTVASQRLVHDELDLLEELVALDGQRIIELGCGAAALARALLGRHPGCSVTALEVDVRQHEKNLAKPQDRLTFVAAGAQAVPRADASFDLALMLKSLHHVPMPEMSRALDEVARVLRCGGLLYVSEPVFDGPFNDVVRLFHDEGVVRAAAQAALDRVLEAGKLWEPAADIRFMMPVSFRSFEDFEARLMRPTFADHQIDDAKLAQVRAAFAPHLGSEGAHFIRPMHVRLLRRAPRA